MKWIPNALSITRALLAAPIVVLALKQNWVAACVLLILACLTDFFDGLAAIKLDASSEFGKKILDPVGDTLMFSAALSGLVFQGRILHNFLTWGLPMLVIGS